MVGHFTYLKRPLNALFLDEFLHYFSSNLLISTLKQDLEFLKTRWASGAKGARPVRGPKGGRPVRATSDPTRMAVRCAELRAHKKNGRTRWASVQKSV